MPINRWLLDTIGFLVALLCGVGYFFVVFSSFWNSTGSAGSVARGTLLCFLIVFTVLALLNVVLRPNRLWLYPLAFSAFSVFFGVLGLRDAAGPNLLWLWVAAFTVIAALASSYATSHALSRWMRTRRHDHAN
jgi:hypothetical protein